jgi:hypothetical protein
MKRILTRDESTPPLILTRPCKNHYVIKPFFQKLITFSFLEIRILLSHLNFKLLKRNLETYNIYKFSKNAINPKYDMLKLLHIN